MFTPSFKLVPLASVLMLSCASNGAQPPQDNTDPTLSVSKSTPTAPVDADSSSCSDDSIPDTVATYGDQSILRADLEKAAAKSDITAKQALYQGRKDAIDQLINDGLLQKEAAEASASKSFSKPKWR